MGPDLKLSETQGYPNEVKRKLFLRGKLAGNATRDSSVSPVPAQGLRNAYSKPDLKI